MTNVIPFPRKPIGEFEQEGKAVQQWLRELPNTRPDFPLVKHLAALPDSYYTKLVEIEEWGVYAFNLIQHTKADGAEPDSNVVIELQTKLREMMVPEFAIHSRTTLARLEVVSTDEIPSLDSSSADVLSAFDAYCTSFSDLVDQSHEVLLLALLNELSSDPELKGRSSVVLKDGLFLISFVYSGQRVVNCTFDFLPALLDHAAFKHWQELGCPE